MESSKEVPQKLKIERPYDLAILLLGRYAKEIKPVCWRDGCIPTFTITLPVRAKCLVGLATYEWVKKEHIDRL